MFKSRGLNQPSLAGAILSYAVLLFWAFVVLFPLYWLVVTSFKLPFHVNEGPYYVPFIDYQPSGHAWRYVFVDVVGDMIRPYTNTVVVSLASSVLALIFGGTAAYGLTRFRYRPRQALIWLFIILLAGVIFGSSLGVPLLLLLAVAIAIFFLALRPLAQTIPRARWKTVTSPFGLSRNAFCRRLLSSFPSILCSSKSAYSIRRPRSLSLIWR